MIWCCHTRVPKLEEKLARVYTKLPNFIFFRKPFTQDYTNEENPITVSGTKIVIQALQRYSSRHGALLHLTPSNFSNQRNNALHPHDGTDAYLLLVSSDFEAFSPAA